MAGRSAWPSTVTDSTAMTTTIGTTGAWLPIWPWIVGLLVLLLIGGGVAAYLLTRPKKVLVPNVVNLTLPIAQTAIQDAGFTPNVISETSNYAVNEVIAQNPLGNARVKSGLDRDADVSTGPGTTTVPTVASADRRRRRRRSSSRAG